MRVDLAHPYCAMMMSAISAAIFAAVTVITSATMIHAKLQLKASFEFLEKDALKSKSDSANARGAQQQAQELRRDFTAIILHVLLLNVCLSDTVVPAQEIRNPLQTITSMIEVLEHLAMTTIQRDAVQAIAESVHVMKELCDSVLDLSKVEAGKLAIQLSSFSLFNWVASVTAGFGAVAEKKSLAFRVVQSPDTPDSIISDSGRLRQVAVNLLSNAFKVRINWDSRPISAVVLAQL